MKILDNVFFEQKTALYFKGRRITPYAYDKCDSKYGIIVMQRGNIIDVYSYETGEKLYYLVGVDSFKIEKDVIILSDGRYYGIRTHDGRVILGPKYSSITNCNGYLKVVDYRGNMGVYLWKYDELSEIIKPDKYTDIRVHDDGIMVYKKVDEQVVKGYYSLNGDMIIEPKYTEISFASYGIRVMTSEDKIGLYSYSGKQIIPPLYDEIITANNSFIVLTNLKNNRSQVGLYNAEGEKLLESRYDKFYRMSPYCVFEKGILCCLYDMLTGKRILSLKYKHINRYYNAIYATEDFKTFSIYSGKTGKKLLEDKFETVKIYAPFILSVVKNGKPYYYLTLHNMLVDSEKYNVEYSDEYKEVLIGKRDKEKKVLFTEWLNKQS